MEEIKTNSHMISNDYESTSDMVTCADVCHGLHKHVFARVSSICMLRTYVWDIIFEKKSWYQNVWINKKSFEKEMSIQR